MVVAIIHDWHDIQWYGSCSVWIAINESTHCTICNLYSRMSRIMPWPNRARFLQLGLLICLIQLQLATYLPYCGIRLSHSKLRYYNTMIINKCRRVQLMSSVKVHPPDGIIFLGIIMAILHSDLVP